MAAAPVHSFVGLGEPWHVSGSERYAKPERGDEAPGLVELEVVQRSA